MDKIELQHPKLIQFVQWFLTEGRHVKTAVELVYGFIQQLHSLEVSIMRASITLRTLHPQVETISLKWWEQGLKPNLHESPTLLSVQHHSFPKGVITEAIYTFGIFGGERHQRSPFYALLEGADMIHFDITPEQTEFAYPILKDMHALGATGYVALPLDYNSGLRETCGWTTKHPEGFTPEALTVLKGAVVYLAMGLEYHANEHKTASLLSIYLGRKTGKQVLAGKVLRGDVESIKAVIWYSDLRGFTRLSEIHESQQVVAWLNDYFEVVMQTIEQAHGEILKLIGDAILAIFPLATCSGREMIPKALKVALHANAALEALNQQRLSQKLPSLEHGIALHVGTVQYGNIGSPQRLDFTVIGQAVNFASRLEGLCSHLGQRVLVSEDVAQQIPKGLTKLGEFSLKGIVQPQPVFAPVSDTCSSP